MTQVLDTTLTWSTKIQSILMDRSRHSHCTQTPHAVRRAKTPNKWISDDWETVECREGANPRPCVAIMQQVPEDNRSLSFLFVREAGSGGGPTKYYILQIKARTTRGLLNYLFRGTKRRPYYLLELIYCCIYLLSLCLVDGTGRVVSRFETKFMASWRALSRQ